MLRIRAVLIESALLACALTATQGQESLIHNGTFARPGPTGVAEGWQLAGPLLSAKLDTNATRNGWPTQRVRGSGRLTLWQEVEVTPDTEFLFRAWVKSDDRIVVRLGRRTLSYSDQGRWQKLAGLVRTKTARRLRVEFLLGGLTQPPSTIWLNSASLNPVQRPATPRRSTFGPTILVDKGRPAAFIVYPSGPSMYEALARKVQLAARECTGATLPIVSDADATDVEHPKLKPELKRAHLILLGRLGINRALWPAYSRFLCAADGYYPGGDGYVVRTAANVMRNGKNHIVLAGSTENGAARAVDQFVARVRDLKPQPDGSLLLPWLLDVKLGGECKAAFEADDKLWATDPWNSLLPPKEPGYGTVRRWYHNAMAYYWSGWSSYQQRMFTCLEPVLRERARTHHYIAEFWVRTYDMLDDSGVLSPEQMAAMDDLIVRNFWELSIGPDLIWMKTFSPPYDAIRFTSRHNIAPWMADIVMADFVQDYLQPTGLLAEIAKFQGHEKHALMRHVVRERWSSSLPGPHYSSAEEEISKSLFRYALEHAAFEFFDRGNAKRALHLDKIDHLEGLCARPWGSYDHHLLLGALAHYYRDGRYAALRKQLPIRVHATGFFMGRYVNGVRRFVPGPELEVADPDSFTGVRIPAMMPHDQGFLGRFNTSRCQATGLDSDHALDFIAFRSGFGSDDDYLALNGLAGQYPPGVILSLVSCGAKWLTAGWSRVYGPTTGSYFDFNAVNVLRTDRWLDQKKPYAAVARLDWHANLHRAGGVALTLDPFMDTTWRREILWIQPRLFVVRDTVTAREDGCYEIAVTWRPGGAPSWDGRTWTGSLGCGSLRVTPMGRGFRVRQNLDDYLARLAKRLFVRHVASAQLAKGESVASTTLLETSKPNDAVHEAELVSRDCLLLNPREGDEALAVRWGPIEEDAAKTDARALVTSSTRLQAMAATRLQWRGEPVLSASQPLSLSVDCAKGKLIVDGGRNAAKLTLMPGTAQFVAQVSPGLLRLDLPGRTASALRTLLSQGAPLPTDPPSPAGPPTDQGVKITDQTARWTRTWAYDGLKRPARVRTIASLADNVCDLGSIVELDEIRAILTSGTWQATRFPEAFYTALPGEDGRLPPLDGPGWRKLPAKPQ